MPKAATPRTPTLSFPANNAKRQGHDANIARGQGSEIGRYQMTRGRKRYVSVFAGGFGRLWEGK